jgi:GTP pyrophosphokinase
MSDESRHAHPAPTPEWIAQPAPLGERFDAALELAANAHRAQRRKGGEIPYIGHLLGVCSLVIEEGGSEDEAVAALLHDIVEDQGGSARLDEVRERFGDQVAMIVESCSDRIDEKDELPWRERKERYLAELDSHPAEVLIVSLADKLYNARAVERDYRAYGESFWSRFNGGREGTLWYYTALSEAFDRLMPECRMTAELRAVVATLNDAAASVQH